MSDRDPPKGAEELPEDEETRLFSEAGSRELPRRDKEGNVPPTEAYDQIAGDLLDDWFDTTMLDPPTQAAALGRLGKYEILKVIGQGGMGVVFRGFDESLHRDVAIKVLARQLATSQTARRRFIREARAAAAINHPNVVTIHAVEDQQGVPYLVMALVNGRSLHDRIRADAPLPLADVLRLSAQIASGLAAAHAQGVIHRDIKPANIMLEDNVDRVKITDFGLARVAMDNADLTSYGHRLGTPAYMSPEQVSGKQVDERTDLFSLGCVIYAMIAGSSPFRGTHSFDAARKILEETPQRLDEISSDVPPFLAEIVERLLAKKASARFQTAAELAELLNHYTTRLNQTRTDELSQVLRKERLPWRRWLGFQKWLFPAALAAIGVVVLGSAYVFIGNPWTPRGNPAPPQADADAAKTGGTRDAVPSTMSDAASDTTRDTPPEAPLLTGALTVAKSGQALFRSITDALHRAGPGATITVTDDATYNEALAITNAEQWRDITLEATGHATLTAPFPTPVLLVRATPGVTVRGFHIVAHAGQHGLEVTGPCPGLLMESLSANRIPNDNDSPRHLNFAYFHAGAAGTGAAPIVLRQFTLSGGGHGIAIGELSPTEADVENPVRWLRIEECALFNPNGRSDYRLFLLNYVSDIVITRNSFADAEVGISLLLKQPNQASRIKLHQNTFHNITSLLANVVNGTQEDFEITSNLISRTDRVTGGLSPATALPTAWFSGNAWVDAAAITDPAVAAVATVVRDVRFESEDPTVGRYLHPTVESFEPLLSVGPVFPGRFSAE